MQCIGGLLRGKCMDRAEIIAQLQKLPAEAAAACALRVGLRVLPWLALSKDKQALARWKEEDRAKHLLGVLLAYDVALMVVWDRKATGVHEAAQARLAAAYDDAAT